MTHLTIDLLPDGSDALEGAFVASQYYGGQWTALYALASTGSLELYEGEGLQRLRGELCEAILHAENMAEVEDIHPMQALLTWVDNELWKARA
jgi:hypothetical protein